MQVSLACYLLALGISGLIYGPLSDYFGRKPILYLGYSIFLVGTILVICSFDIEIFLIGRLIQGLGAGSPVVIARAIYRDQYETKQLEKVISLQVIIFALCSAIAPLLGGYIHTLFGWRANFYFILFYLLFICSLVIFFVPKGCICMGSNKFNAITICPIFSSVRNWQGAC